MNLCKDLHEQILEDNNSTCSSRKPKDADTKLPMSFIVVFRELLWMLDTSSGTRDNQVSTRSLKAKHGVPDYLGSLLTVYQPTRTSRSSDNGLLYRPRTSSDFESYCFTSAATTIWRNSLSVTTRTANSIGTFRSRLKTDLFAKAYAT